MGERERAGKTMNRKYLVAKTITMANDASCINNDRGMARKAKRHSAKMCRTLLKKETREEMQD